MEKIIQLFLPTKVVELKTQPHTRKTASHAAAATAPTPEITKRGQAKSPALRPNAAEVLQGAARSRKPAAAAATKKPPPKKATGKELPERLTRGAASLGAAADAAADATTDEDDPDDDDDSAQREAVGGEDDGEEAGEDGAVDGPVSDPETVLEDDDNEVPNPMSDQPTTESRSLAAGLAPAGAGSGGNPPLPPLPPSRTSPPCRRRFGRCERRRGRRREEREPVGWRLLGRSPARARRLHDFQTLRRCARRRDRGVAHGPGAARGPEVGRLPGDHRCALHTIHIYPYTYVVALIHDMLYI